MKEIISKRSKKLYVFMLIFSIVSIVLTVIYMRVFSRNRTEFFSIFRGLSIAVICVLTLGVAEWTFFLVDPRGVIEKDGDTLLITRGAFTTKVNVKDILEVSLTPELGKKGGVMKNCVSIKAIVKGKEKTLAIGDVVDPESAVEKITALINGT